MRAFRITNKTSNLCVDMYNFEVWVTFIINISLLCLYIVVLGEQTSAVAVGAQSVELS